MFRVKPYAADSFHHSGKVTGPWWISVTGFDIIYTENDNNSPVTVKFIIGSKISTRRIKLMCAEWLFRIRVATDPLKGKL